MTSCPHQAWYHRTVDPPLHSAIALAGCSSGSGATYFTYNALMSYSEV